jgi:hypothetical protein
MVKDIDFLGSLDTNPFHFRQYGMTYFAMYANGKQIPSEGHLNMVHERTSVLGYRTLFEASGINHSNAGLQITHDMYIAGYFMLLLDLTPYRVASEGHASQPDSGNIMIEIKFTNPLPDAVTCLLYLEYDNCIRVDSTRTVTTDY